MKKYKIWYTHTNPQRFASEDEDLYIRASDGAVFSYEADYGGTFSSHEKLVRLNAVSLRWTGCYDKNKTPIYEGDILKYDIGLGPLYYEVYMDTEKGMWRITKENGGNTADWFDQYEVAGNIMENPKLYNI